MHDTHDVREKTEIIRKELEVYRTYMRMKRYYENDELPKKHLIFYQRCSKTIQPFLAHCEGLLSFLHAEDRRFMMDYLKEGLSIPELQKKYHLTRSPVYQRIMTCSGKIARRRSYAYGNYQNHC